MIKNERELEFRQSDLKDVETTFRLKKSGLKEYVEQIWGWDETDQRERQKSTFKPELTTIISHDGQDVGYLVKKEVNNKIYIENLILGTEFQNSGIGTKVLELIIEEAEHKNKSIRLKVLKINSRAKKFYENFGLCKISESEFHYEMEKKHRT